MNQARGDLRNRMRLRWLNRRSKPLEFYELSRVAVSQTIMRSKWNIFSVSREMQNEAKYALSLDGLGTCRINGCRDVGSEMFQTAPTRFCKTKPNSNPTTHPTGIGGLTHPHFGTASSVAAIRAVNVGDNRVLMRSSMIRPIVKTLHSFRVLLDQSPGTPVCSEISPTPHRSR